MNGTKGAVSSVRRSLAMMTHIIARDRLTLDVWVVPNENFLFCLKTYLETYLYLSTSTAIYIDSYLHLVLFTSLNLISMSLYIIKQEKFRLKK